MINFRFHLVSLIAVFLALALGVVMGSTVIDQAIVDGLESQLDRVEAKADETRRDNSRLSDELDPIESYLDDTAAFAVDGRLSGVRIVVVALRGVDEERVERLASLLREADAIAPVLVWLERPWTLERDGDISALRAAVGGTGDVTALRDRGLRALAVRLGGPRGSAPDGPDVADEAPDLLAQLLDADFVSIDGLDDDAVATFPDGPTTAVLVGGPGTDLDAASVLPTLAASFDDRATPTIAVESDRGRDGDPARGVVLAGIRDDDVLSGAVATVDDLDLATGALSAVLALEELTAGRVGHYGYGSGASRPAPEWSGQ